MKQLLLAIVIALSALACTGQGSQESAASVAPAQDAIPADQVATQPESHQPPTTPDPGDSIVVGDAGSEAHLPQGIALEFPYIVRAQRKATSNNGEPRDWLGLEFQDGQEEDIASSIEVSMLQAGFTPIPVEGGSGDAIRLKFEKRGYGVVFATVRGAEGQKLVYPASKGVIWLDFPGQ